LASAPAEARRHQQWAVDQAPTQVPKDLEICFSPDEHCDRKIVTLVDSAKVSLDIAIYDINLDSLVTHIIQKSKQIPVRMVVDRGQAKTEHSAVPRLLAAGVKIKFGSQRGIMHNKFLLVDGKMMETGSFNQTNGASFYNNENQLYLSNPKVLDRYKKRFEWLWENGKLPKP
jgi:phosphatidylserine/phosphatidylglycerophosphate/cardiolipin synthase-like enzyme